MNPLVPLGIACRVRLLVLGLENPDNLPIRTPRKIAARAPLRDHTRVHLLANSAPHALDHSVELAPCHDALLLFRQVFGGDRLHAIRRLKDGVVDFQRLVVKAGALVSAPLEPRGNLVCPALQTRVDGLEIHDGATAPTTTAELGPDGPRAAHAGALTRPTGDGCISRYGRWLKRRVRGGQGVVVGAIVVGVAEAVGLG